MKTIKVLIVDDSAFMRREIKRILESDPSLEVVPPARNGVEALEAIEKHKPDVITLDINMPEMDGLTCLSLISEKYDIPVIMLSSLTQEGEITTFEALELGAVDFIGKPGGTVSKNIEKVEKEIISKVKGAAGVNMKNSSKRPVKKFLSPVLEESKKEVKSRTALLHHKVVVLGMSTGGPKTIFDVLPKLPSDIDFAIIVVQHMPPAYTAGFAKRIDQACQFPFKEACNGEELKVGCGYLAPGGSHLTLQKTDFKDALGYKMRLTKFPSDTEFMPSVDVMFKSFSNLFKDKCLGVLMTGMGSDGVEGMIEIKKNGGVTIAESEETCVVFGMPSVAINKKCVDYIVPSYDIAERILMFTKNRLGKRNVL